MAISRNSYLIVCIVRKNINISSSVLFIAIESMGWFVKMLRDRGRAELYFSWEVEGNLNALALLATVDVDSIMLGVFLVARGEIRLPSLNSYI